MSDLFDGSEFDGGVPPAIPPTAGSGYLGRFQLGQTLPLSVSPLDTGGFTIAPDAAPSVVIQDATNHTVFTASLAMDGGSTVFSLPVLLGLEFSLGTFHLTYSCIVNGITQTATRTFDVIPGGDPGGQVVSLYAYDRPEARYVVAQLSNGMIVQGRNPQL